MEITSKHIGQSVKTVVVTFAPGEIDPDFPFVAHEQATTAAMEATGETPERLMDWDTDRYDGSPNSITVRLYTQ